MEKKAFIVLCILIATSSTARTTPAESSSTTPAASTSSTSSFTTSAHTASVLLELRCSETFIPELNDSSSQAFKDRAKHVKDNLETIYKWKYPSFIRAHVLSFRPGSIITDSVLEFNLTELVIPPNEILLDDLVNALNMSSVSVTAVTKPTAEPVTSNTSASKITLPTSTTPSSAAFHTTQSSTTPTTASTNNATSTTTGSSKATSTLAGSSTASTFNTTTSKSISPTSAAFHNTTQSSTTKETSTTTASQPTASTLISAGSVSPASASSTLNKTSTTTESSRTTPTLASFNTTTPQTILSSTALKSTAVSVTNTSTTSAGPTTKVPTVPEIVTDLEFHSSDTFTSALDNSESQEFKNRSKLVTDQLEAVYKPKYDNFLRATVQGFRAGSIITTTRLVFFLSSNQPVPSSKEISETLLKAAETGNINPLNIISQTISVNGSTFAAPAAPSTETTASRASKIELHLLQATCLIIMAKILRLFL